MSSTHDQRLTMILYPLQNHYVSLCSDNGVTSYLPRILIRYKSALNARSTTFLPITIKYITFKTNSVI